VKQFDALKKAYFLVSCAAVFAAAMLILSSGDAAAQSRVPPKVVHEEAFQDNLRRALDGKVKGYAFVIANGGGIVAKASGGWAQAPGDGNLRMKTFIPAQIGSVVKVASGVAFLDLLEAKRPPGQSVSQALDVSIRHYVPDRWLKAYFARGPNDPSQYVPAVNRITLRHLLNHRSGLRKFPNGGAHGTIMARTLADGPNPLRIGTGPLSYLNENFTLLLYIIPRLAYPNAVDSLERAHANKSLKDYNVAIAKSYGVLYERYMREKFFPRTLAPIAPTCRPGEEIANGRYAKEYASKDAARGKTGRAAFCRSQGSWYFSAQDLAQLARTIELSDRFIEASTRSLLYVPAFPRKRLIYWRLVNNQILARDPGGAGKYRAHGGKTVAGATAAWSGSPSVMSASASSTAATTDRCRS